MNKNEVPPTSTQSDAHTLESLRMRPITQKPLDKMTTAEVANRADELIQLTTPGVEGNLYDFMDNLARRSDVVKVPKSTGGAEIYATKAEKDTQFLQARAAVAICSHAAAIYRDVKATRERYDADTAETAEALQELALNAGFANRGRDGNMANLKADTVQAAFKWALEAFVAAGEKVGRQAPDKVKNASYRKNAVEDMGEMLRAYNRFH